jgi:hypothetical protein
MPVYEMAHPVYGEIVSERRENKQTRAGYEPFPKKCDEEDGREKSEKEHFSMNAKGTELRRRRMGWRT